MPALTEQVTALIRARLNPPADVQVEYFGEHIVEVPDPENPERTLRMRMHVTALTRGARGAVCHTDPAIARLHPYGEAAFIADQCTAHVELLLAETP